MQKMMLFLTFCLGISFTVQAQKTPPVAVVSAFSKKFPNTKAEWGKEKNGDWEAEFGKNGAEMSANFTAEGKWLETETEIKFADLPAPVQVALKGKKVKETAKIVKADGTTVYEAEVHKDLIFDARGKLLSSEKE